MLGTATYHRYPPPGQMQRVRKPRKTAAGGAAEPAAVKPTRQPPAPARPATGGGISHAEDLVARLNARLAPYNTALYFETDDNPQQPNIKMKRHADQQLVRNFASGDMLELERGVFELSGFHLSLTA